MSTTCKCACGGACEGEKKETGLAWWVLVNMAIGLLQIAEKKAHDDPMAKYEDWDAVLDGLLALRHVEKAKEVREAEERHWRELDKRMKEHTAEMLHGTDRMCPGCKKYLVLPTADGKSAFCNKCGWVGEAQEGSWQSSENTQDEIV